MAAILPSSQLANTAVSISEVHPVVKSRTLHALRYSLTCGAWVAAQLSTAWWTVSVGQLSASRPPAPTSSVIVNDFAGIGIVFAWLIAATTAHVMLFASLLVFGRAPDEVAAHEEASWFESVVLAAVVNVATATAFGGVTLAYTWTVATMPAMEHVMNRSSPYLSSVWLQSTSLLSTILFCGIAAAWVNTTQTQAHRIAKRELAAQTAKDI